MTRPKLQHILVAIVATVASASVSAQHFEITAPPDWVVPIEPVFDSEVSKYDVSSGAYFSVIDHQINLENEYDYTHGVTRIVSSAGITSASEIMISYDSSYQRVLFHHLYVWRDGKKMDRTDQLSFETLNQEENLGAGIYTGLLTAYDILEDLRSGDMIDYAYTVIGNNPIYDGHEYRMFFLEDANPVDLLSVRVIHSKKRTYHQGCNGCDSVDIKEAEDGRQKVITITARNVPAADIEDSRPSWEIPYKYFSLSSVDNWQEVNDWALGLFELNDEEAEVDEVFEEVLTTAETTDEKIEALLDYVQNDIRYMGIESGIGSIKPFPPKKVVAQRYGDCKDKTLLFITLLKQLGINTAYPALVNLSIQKGISSILPGAHTFDHAIVCLDYEGERYWIDPTLIQQGGDFKHRVISDYGMALVVKPGNTRLTDMEINDTVSRTHIEEHLTINSFDGPAKLKVVTHLYGQNADHMRTLFEYYSMKDASDELRNAYVAVFPSIMEADRLKVKDDLENNVLTLIESYEIDYIWMEDDGYFMKMAYVQYEPVTLYSYIGPVTCERKDFSVEVPYPASFTQKTVLELPETTSVNLKDQSIFNPAFKFDKTIRSIDSNIIEVNYAFKTHAREITAEEYRKVCMDINSAAHDLPIRVNYPHSRLMEAGEED